MDSSSYNRAPDFVSRGQRITAAWANRLAAHDISSRLLPRCGSGFQPTSGGLIPPVPDSPDPRAAPPSPFPFGANWPWGVGFDGLTCYIWNGILNVGGSWVYNAGPLSIAVSADGDWIGYEYNLNDTTWALVCQPALPQPGEGYLRGPLYKVAKFQSPVGTDRAIFTIDLAHGLAPTNTYA